MPEKKKQNGRLSDRYLTVNQTASLLHVHPKTVKRWIYEGRLIGYRISERKILISRQDVEKFLKKGELKFVMSREVLESILKEKNDA